WTADALYAEALHLADAVSPAGGLALGDALRRIADSQILEALGATTARYWEVVDGKTVSLFEASFALADEACGGALPGAVRRAARARCRDRVMSDAPIPGHVAVIMDGNGRWAERQGLARTEGHKQGEERLAEIVRAADRLGVPWLTAYGFSTENWRRPRLEV